MSTAVIISLVIAAAVVLGAAVLFTSARRGGVRGGGVLSRETRQRDRKTQSAPEAEISGRDIEREANATRGGVLVKASPPEIQEWSPPDEETLGVTRRQFFNRATVTLMTASLGGFGAASIGFLWKGAEGGFGSKISVGKIDEVTQRIRANKGFLYLSEARSWVTEYPKDAIGKAKIIYGNQAPVFSGMEAGIVALYQKCPHLGCRVPECKSSQWFECPCHGSQYNRVGEKKGGPAPRGMDRFAVSITNGVLVIDTGAVFAGPAIGINTTGQEAEGPHCIGLTGGH
ncbi:MAG: Rieske 2Fe-2S domain-containing protein [Ilumatobacteraceae bacterium]|nr:Rieske 2Fe-2S domain-containing protein [Ilumatobacteraceae bacterium]MBJ7367066.1 Rieske 2Fe-2S domain-containing protein [Ilumatobacteraceae bacterium]MBJ7486753.1 Rieske 2Fe-2S domain-containing protein [Ilumatobacteraceae bacterium]